MFPGRYIYISVINRVEHMPGSVDACGVSHEMWVWEIRCWRATQELTKFQMDIKSPFGVEWRRRNRTPSKYHETIVPFVCVYYTLQRNRTTLNNIDHRKRMATGEFQRIFFFIRILLFRSEMIRFHFDSTFRCMSDECAWHHRSKYDEHVLGWLKWNYRLISNQFWLFYNVK